VKDTRTVVIGFSIIRKKEGIPAGIIADAYVTEKRRKLEPQEQNAKAKVRFKIAVSGRVRRRKKLVV